MNRQSRNAVVIVVLSLMIPFTAALSQPGKGPRSGRQLMYDPGTVMSLKGEISSIDTVAGSGRMPGGIHMLVRSDTLSMSVHLGPAWYVAKQDLKLEKGDMVSVTGSRILYDGKPALVASEVKKG